MKVSRDWNKCFTVHDPKPWAEQEFTSLEMPPFTWKCFKMRDDPEALERLATHVQAAANPAQVIPCTF
jgi:hypothetical protein